MLDIYTVSAPVLRMQFLPLSNSYAVEIPMFSVRVQAGFPSPADDHLDQRLDLNEYLIKHPAATYYVRAAGDSMEGIGIYGGDILIVDRAVNAQDGDVVIAAVNGELTCKILDHRQKRLLSANQKYQPLAITEELEVVIEGVVISIIRRLRNLHRGAG